MASALTQSTNSILKSQIFRNHHRQTWKKAITAKNDIPRKFTYLSLLPLSRHLHLRPHYLPINHRNLLSIPPLPPLLRFRQPPLSPPMSSLTPPDSNPSKTVRVVVKGRVQGVFYRNWTVENATQLGLKGWVRNRRDGSVEALFSGIPDKVQEMEQRCRRGPPDAMVTDLQVSACSDDPGTGFQRKPTV
ncbi:hypothetical protein F0562_016506 [Nyssa sinensis]|uniref:acylphosphatase n=1 Tax=Nyssa sinensis TaxID=561372 RepID=A0A5J4ZJ59_9ASTE|nr:hypothetical protein F0562_016506 [Nyssa sinensis]